MLRSRRHAFLIVSLLALALAAAGCSSTGSGTQSSGDGSTGTALFESGARLRSVSASLDESALAEDVVAAAKQFTVTDRLQTRVRSTAPAGSGDLDVEISVVGMRLRSVGSAIWWGVMAGADTLTVDVTVRRGSQTVETFQTGVSTMLGGFAFGGREVRVDRMVNELARRIVAGI